MFRRRFLAALGVSPISFLMRKEDGLDKLVAQAYQRVVASDLYIKHGPPSYIFVHCGHKHGGREVLKAQWHQQHDVPRTVPPVGEVDIDLGELSPIVNQHCRLVYRAADRLSEQIGCKFGWSYDTRYDDLGTERSIPDEDAKIWWDTGSTVGE